MTNEILREVGMLEGIEEAISEHVLTWAHRVEAQRIVLNSIKEANELYAISQNIQKM